MSTTENKAIIDRFNVALNEGNLDVIDTIFAPDFVGHSPFCRSPSGALAATRRSWLRWARPCPISIIRVGR